MTQREHRLRQRIDQLTDQRDHAQARWREAAAARDRLQRDLDYQRRRAELWIHRCATQGAKVGKATR